MRNSVIIILYIYMNNIFNQGLLPNKYIIKDNICFIFFSGTYSYLYTMIDIEDIPLVQKVNKIYYVRMKSTGYAVFDCIVDGRKQHILLSRYIMESHGYDINNMIVDHINHNTLDNRKCNLRICNKSQNNFNGRVAKNNTSGVKGVYRGKGNKWRACIWVYNELKCLGTYETFDEAVIARKNAEQKYFGNYNYSVEEDTMYVDENLNHINPFYMIK